MKDRLGRNMYVNRHWTIRVDQAEELARIQALAAKEFTVLAREGLDLLITKYRKKYPLETQQ